MGPAQPMYMEYLTGNDPNGYTSSQIDSNDSAFTNAYDIWQNTPIRDIVEPTLNEQVRAEYLERQMGSISQCHLICPLLKMS